MRRRGGVEAQGEGVGQDRDAPGVPDHGDGFAGGKAVFADVSLAVVPQVNIEGLLDGPHPALQKEGPGDVGPPHLAAAGDGLHLVPW